MTDDERQDVAEIIYYGLKGGCWCDCRVCRNACDSRGHNDCVDNIIDTLALFFKKQPVTARLEKLVSDFEEAVEKLVYKDS